jgi:hypothetical protein
VGEIHFTSSAGIASNTIQKRKAIAVAPIAADNSSYKRHKAAIMHADVNDGDLKVVEVATKARNPAASAVRVRGSRKSLKKIVSLQLSPWLTLHTSVLHSFLLLVRGFPLPHFLFSRT